MIDQIARIINEHDRFVVITHVNPDGDAIGSLLGMYLALREMGKTATPIMDDELPVLYEFLPGTQNIQIGLDHLEFDPSYIIALDVAAENRIAPEITNLRQSATVINIDHHPTNPGYGDLNYIVPHANATSQLVYEILHKIGYELSVDVAKCLYTALITDTGCFKFAGVTNKTFELAAKLLEAGVDNYEITRYLFEEFPASRLMLEKLMLERLEVLLDGKLVISCLNREDYDKIGASLAEGESLVNKLRETRGVEVGMLITRLSDNLCKASLRSKGFVDVSAIAAELGGGGHRRAAGVKSPLSLGDFKAKLVELVGKAL